MVLFQNKVTGAEVIVTNFLVQHNLLISTVDHIGPLFENISLNLKLPLLVVVVELKHLRFLVK